MSRNGGLRTAASHIRHRPDQREMWNSAADREERSFSEWACRALDLAASRVLVAENNREDGEE